MADLTLNRYIASGNTAARLAFTPSPATPGSGPAFGEIWWDTDLQALFAWNQGTTAWVAVAGSGTVAAAAIAQILRRPDDRTKLVMIPAQASTSTGGPSITSGPYASLPATSNKGDLYFTTDSYYSTFVCTSANVFTPFIGGLQAALPGLVSGWTGVNTGSNWTATDVNGAVQVQITNNASTNWRLLTKAQPSTPYTFTFIWAFFQQQTNSQDTGVYFYDGTKLMGLECLTQSGVFTIRVEKITNVTTDNTTAASHALFSSGNFPISVSPLGSLSPLGPLMYGRLANSGTTLTFSYSLDGVVWTSLFSEAVGTFITPTKYGFGGINVNGGSNTIIQNMLSIVQS